MYEKLFFPSSKRMSAQIVEVFDFLWPTSVALWNLRRQVSDVISESPGTSDAELRTRFVDGSGIHGANLRRSCLEVTWDSQQSQMAKFMLSEICGLYEAWYSALNEELAGLFDDKQLKTYETQDILKKIEKIQIVSEFESSYYNELIKEKKCTFGKMKSLICCYRFFKELRNGQIHNGGIAGDRQVKAYDRYQLVSASDLGVKEKPLYPEIVLGEKYVVSLRGVVGFGDVVLRMIYSLDAEFSKTELARPHFLEKWKLAVPVKPVLPHSSELANLRVQRLLRKMRLKPAKDCSDLTAYLKNANLVI